MKEGVPLGLGAGWGGRFPLCSFTKGCGAQGWTKVKSHRGHTWGLAVVLRVGCSTEGESSDYSESPCSFPVAALLSAQLCGFEQMLALLWASLAAPVTWEGAPYGLYRMHLERCED